jgi:hypothetical protein
MFSDVELYRMDQADADHRRRVSRDKLMARGFTRGDNGVIELNFPTHKNN